MRAAAEVERALHHHRHREHGEGQEEPEHPAGASRVNASSFSESLRPSTGVGCARLAALACPFAWCQDARAASRLARQRRQPERAEPGGSGPSARRRSRVCRWRAPRDLDADSRCVSVMLGRPPAGQPAVQSDSRRPIRGRSRAPRRARHPDGAASKTAPVLARERERAPFDSVRAGWGRAVGYFVGSPLRGKSDPEGTVDNRAKRGVQTVARAPSAFV